MTSQNIYPFSWDILCTEGISGICWYEMETMVEVYVSCVSLILVVSNAGYTMRTTETFQG
jgi:hypothetical protein